MRMEAKVGLVVVALAAIGVAGYFIYNKTKAPAEVAVTPAPDKDNSFGGEDFGTLPPVTPTSTAGAPGPVVTPPPVAGSSPKMYTVQQSDTYQTIALREYGDVSLASLIERANPGRRLIPGLVISVPAAPNRVGGGLAPPTGGGLAPPGGLTAIGGGAPGGTAAVGATGLDPVTGKRFYVVKQGDNGFWGVAKAAYGDGNKYKLVQDANPGMNTQTMRPGTKVWVPDAPVVAGGAPTTRPSGMSDPSVLSPLGPLTPSTPTTPRTVTRAPAPTVPAGLPAVASSSHRTGAPVRSGGFD